MTCNPCCPRSSPSSQSSTMNWQNSYGGKTFRIVVIWRLFYDDNFLAIRILIKRWLRFVIERPSEKSLLDNFLAHHDFTRFFFKFFCQTVFWFDRFQFLTHNWDCNASSGTVELALRKYTRSFLSCRAWRARK